MLQITLSKVYLQYLDVHGYIHIQENILITTINKLPFLRYYIYWQCPTRSEKSFSLFIATGSFKKRFAIPSRPMSTATDECF